MRYQLVVDLTAAGLAKKIEAYLNDDWELHGSVSIAYVDAAHSFVFAQAVTNEADEPEPETEPIDHRELAEIVRELLERAKEAQGKPPSD